METIKITVLTSIYRGSMYLENYFQQLNKLSEPEKIEVLLLHNDPQEDELEIINSQLTSIHTPVIRHIIIPQRESLYKTWNRGVGQAIGAYLAIWNVDDTRYPDSLARQAATLDQNSDTALNYGDQIDIDTFGDREGRLSSHPEFKGQTGRFMRHFYGGCFMMWRKEIHAKIGYFDEQMLSGGDFDFWIRVLRNYPVKKTPAILGCYLNEHRGLSTRSWLQPVEHNVVALRYGHFDQINFLSLLKTLRRYRIYSLLKDGKLFPIGVFFRRHAFYVIGRIPLLLWGLLKYPFCKLVPGFLRIVLYLFKEKPESILHRIERRTGLRFTSIHDEADGR